MAQNTMVRVIVPTAVADAAHAKAGRDGKTLTDVVAELLARYAGTKPKRARRKTT